MEILMYSEFCKDYLLNFEKKVYDLFEEGDLPYLIHLCGGNEDILIDLFKTINKDDWVFSTHRSHYHYLLKGGSQNDLLNKIKNGDSMFVFNKELKFLSSSILAGCCGIAVGVALAIKLSGGSNKVICFLGDGAADEGHFYESVRFADAMELPIKFIVEDNDRSVDTTKAQRGSDTIWLHSSKVIYYLYTPTYPHASTGSGKMVKFKKEIVDRYLNENSKD